MKVENIDIINAITSAVCARYNVTISQIDSPSRTREVTEPRHIIIGLSYALTSNSQEIIGKYFGGKDHALVNYAFKKVVDLYAFHKDYKESIDDIIKFVNIQLRTRLTFEDVSNARTEETISAKKAPNMLDIFNELWIEAIHCQNPSESLMILDSIRNLYHVITNRENVEQQKTN